MFYKVLQSIVNQMSSAITKEFGVIDEKSVIVAASKIGKVGEVMSDVAPKTVVVNSTFVHGNMTFHAIGLHRTEYIVYVEGDDEISRSYAMILGISIMNALNYHDEKHDKVKFIKNIILNNSLPGDIQIKSREMKLNNTANRVVFYIKCKFNNDAFVYDIVSSLFPDKSKDMVISLSETDLVLVKELTQVVELPMLEKLAATIADALDDTGHVKSVIGIGTQVDTLQGLSRSFKEAKNAVEISKIFDETRNIISYECLGIARLIYQLPFRLCEIFLKEVFNSGSIETLDQETFFTIRKFFEHNLNISETARKLFVHRNTLVYRLEKIKRVTGLDIRNFEDAIVFKIALMVKKYLTSCPVKY